MPETRSKRKDNSVTETSAKMSGKDATNGKVAGPNKQIIMVTPNDFVSGANGEQDCPYLCKLPHPKSGLSTMYAFKDKKSWEILKFSEKYRSWFCNDSVQEDGSLYILSPIDPIFLAIPYLSKIAKKGKYMTLDQTFIDDNYQHGLARLESCLSCSQLERLCDRKGPADLSAFKLNTEKLITWLSQKVEHLAAHLKTTNLHVGTGSQACNFMKSSTSDAYSHDDYLSYAFEFVHDYIDEEISQSLKSSLKIVSTPKANQEDQAPPSKRQKLNGDLVNNGCLEDYRDNQIKLAKKTIKLTAGQKQLAKVDKTGMKSLNNFFMKKPKK